MAERYCDTTPLGRKPKRNFGSQTIFDLVVRILPGSCKNPADQVEHNSADRQQAELALTQQIGSQDAVDGIAHTLVRFEPHQRA